MCTNCADSVHAPPSLSSAIIICICLHAEASLSWSGSPADIFYSAVYAVERRFSGIVDHLVRPEAALQSLVLLAVGVTSHHLLSYNISSHSVTTEMFLPCKHEVRCSSLTDSSVLLVDPR